jgi:molecular chaperone GrpE (heat shock protein)
VTFLEELLAADTEADIQKRIDANAAKITPEFMQVLNSFMTQAEGSGQQQSPEFIEKMKLVYRLALRYTMQANLKK